MYLAERWDQPLPWEAERWYIQEASGGWSLEYIDTLTLQDILDFHAVKRGQAVARKK